MPGLRLLPVCLIGLDPAYAAVHGSAPLEAAQTCDYAQRSGRPFRFATADASLQDYGYVLWKTAPSLAEEPLDYARYHGREGKLTGRSLRRDGVRWFEGIMPDCSLVYAEDASSNADYAGVDHLDMHGKIVFEDTLDKALGLVGAEVVVQGEGLEPGQRLYTAHPTENYPLSDGERLRVVGVDTHRYAHAKGIGPLFLQVRNTAGEQGLIKFNPRYLDAVSGEFPLNPLPRMHAAAPALPGREAAQGGGDWRRDYVLTVSNFHDESAGLAAARVLTRDGFNADLRAQPGVQGTVYKLQIAGFPTLDLAAAMAGILARRFNWVQPRVDLPQRPGT